VRKVNPLVRIVRDNVWLIDLLTMSAEWLLAQQAAVFPDAVKDDDSIVHRVTNQGKQSCDDRQRNFKSKNLEETQGNQDVVKYRQNRRRSVNPLEPEGNIYQHARQSIEGNSDGLIA